MLHLRKDMAELWAGRDPFQAADALEGEVFRSVKNRRTLRFAAAGKSYFIKIHHGVGWREIFKDLVSLRLPIVSARQEWLAIKRLTELNVPTMQVAAFGERGINPAARHSFLVTDELHNTVSLETLCAAWPETPPAVVFKRQLIKGVADIARTLHNNGVFHRDFYLCHFLLHLDSVPGSEKPVLSVIDLHRALISPLLSRRWIEKDIAGLYYSALDIGLTRADLFRFLRVYTGLPLRQVLQGKAGFLAKVQRKAMKIRQRDQRKQAGRKLPGQSADDDYQQEPNRQQQWDELKAQLFCNTVSHEVYRRWDRFAVYRKTLASAEMERFIQDPDTFFYNGRMIKDGDSTTVMAVSINNREYVVKRYNLRNFWYGIRRLFRPSRAWACWRNAHMLSAFNIATPAPAVMLERRWGPFRRQAYYVTELTHGPDVLQFVDDKPINSAQWQWALPRFVDFFAAMARYRFVHGDMKATNFLVADEQLVALDLDAMREVRGERTFLRLFRRDVERWLKNWRDQPGLGLADSAEAQQIRQLTRIKQQVR